MAGNEDAYFVDPKGVKRPKKMTKGWELLVRWDDETSTWVRLADLKESNPVEVAEYAVLHRINKEPAFRWWVPYVLRKRDRIIKKVQKKYWRTEFKFGIRLPKDVAEALRIDEETGTDFWRKAIEKEMSKIRGAYEVRDENPKDIQNGKVKSMIGFQEIKCHMVFDVKADFTRKARFVAGGHTTETPASITYSSVVSRESVRIAFLLAAVNDLEIMSCDIGNAYLNAPCREKVWFVGGLECGEDFDKALVITRGALYGLKSSGASWRQMLADTLEGQGFRFRNTRVDGDIYIRRGDRDQMQVTTMRWCWFTWMTFYVPHMHHRSSWKRLERSTI
jgi:Reverse transcriptase (RNA-dependent DNA polymerase)